jgi:hypothetical protein
MEDLGYVEKNDSFENLFIIFRPSPDKTREAEMVVGVLQKLKLIQILKDLFLEHTQKHFALLFLSGL